MNYDNLPGWVWDLLVDLAEEEATHSDYYRLTAGGEYVKVRPPCCRMFDRQPPGVAKAAEVIRRDRARRAAEAEAEDGAA